MQKAYFLGFGDFLKQYEPKSSSKKYFSYSLGVFCIEVQSICP